MKRRIAWWVAVMALSARAVSAEPLNSTLALVGMLTISAGVGMAASAGDEYHFDDQTICVVNARRINSGHCEEPPPAVVTLAKWTLGVGAVMTVIGFWPKRVTIAPVVSPQIKAITGRVQW